MGILERIRDWDSQNTYVEEKNEAWEQFQTKAAEVSKINQTGGYKAIKDYWTEEVRVCTERLRTMKWDDFRIVQSDLNFAKRFLDWLEMIENAPL